MSRQLPRSRDERGAAAVEYASILLAALLVVSAVVLAFGAFDIGAKVSCALSQVFGDGGACSAVSGDPGASGTPTRDMRPDAGGNVVNDETQTNTGKGGVEFKGGIWSGGASLADGGQMQFQHYEDGSGKYTITDSKTLDIHGGVGDELKGGDAEISAKVQLEGEGTMSDSEIRKCDTASGAGSSRSCSGFRDQYSEQIENHTHQGFSQIGAGDTNIDDPPDQYQHTIQGTFSLNGEIKLNSGGKDPAVNAGASGSAKAGMSKTTTYDSDGKGGKGDVASTTTTFSYSLDDTAEVTVNAVKQEVGNAGVTGHAGLSGGLGVTEKFSYTEDGSGNLTTVTFTTTSHAEGGANAGIDAKGPDGATKPASGKGGEGSQSGDQYETTVTIDVTKLSDSERQTVNNYVHSLNAKSPVFPSSVLNPSEPVGADDEFGTIVHNNAIVTTSHYETETTSSKEEYNYWFASYSNSAEHKDRTLVDQHYLDLPGPDGSRTYRDTDAENKNGK